MVGHPASGNDFRYIALGHGKSAAWVSFRSASTAGGFEPLLDRGARQSGGLRDCAVGEFVAQLHAPDLAYHFHGDHLLSTS